PSGVIEIGEISRVQDIIRNSPDLINAPDKSGQTLLQTYSAKGDLAVVKLLLENGAAINGIKQPELTALHFAAGNGRKAVVEFLLSKGAKVDAVTATGVTPLHLAVLKGYELVAKVLLDAGANVNAPVQKDVNRSTDSLSYDLRANQTPLHLACQEGYGGVVDLLISKGADVTAQDARGQTPLTIAAQANNENIVGTLLTKGANPDAGRFSALALAAAQGNLAMLDLLLSHGTKLNLTNALQAAVKGNRVTAISRLIKAGADPNTKTEQGEPLVFQALNSPDTLRALLDGGANPNQRSTQGDPVLVRAVEADVAVLTALLEHGANPDLQQTQFNGFSALHYAAANSRLTAAQALVTHHANVNIRAHNGETPLHLAVQQRNQELVAFLLENGADPNLQGNNGQTALEIAKQSRSVPPGVAFPSSVAVTPSKQLSMQDLLLQHGASTDLPRMDSIEVRRAPNYSAPAFSRSLNDSNRFSVLELVAVRYGFVSAAPTMFGGSIAIPQYLGSSHTIQWSLAFPDLDKVEIRRPKPGGKGWTLIPVSVRDILASGDCSRDVWLEWGDQVEIPEADHPLDATWKGFSAEAFTNLQKCVERTVDVIVKGQTTHLRLEMPMPTSKFPQISDAPFNYSPPQFCLVPALQRSGLLRSSSDLTHVKVIRHNAATGENWEKTFDFSNALSSPLWLRDGDVIEVPDKT
ncbi:MAG TPA: ankyrin repeat domain-containing protein, partial [Patescibacteria group bacterium]|nr:ankyrin repeat domain-containing protein [Patescibacteria group bacterium]